MPCNTLQYHAIPQNTIQYYAIPMQQHVTPCNNTKYYAIESNKIQCHAIPYSNMKYHGILCNTMQYYAKLYNRIHLHVTPAHTMQQHITLGITMQRHAITSNKMQSHSIAKTAIPSYILKWKDPGYRSLPMFMDFPPNFSLKTRKLLREGLENRNNGFRPLRGYHPSPLSEQKFHQQTDSLNPSSILMTDTDSIMMS